MKHNRKISVIGLGYVGLPVAVAFGQCQNVVGFDVNTSRIKELESGQDSTGEVESEELQNAKILFSSTPDALATANFHIVAVPTPIDDSKQPDLTAMLRASESVGSILKQGDIVVYESTVYPGATEEDCIPVLEQKSGLKSGIDFSVGYSPERINPGDKEHTFSNTLKIVAGLDTTTLEIVAQVYESVISAGVYRAASIRVAEAAKVIENTQRDLNIALMNELALIFERMGIDTLEVLQAAGTKWNFLPFRPGLVGGHCIGVDPYYLAHKAEKLGFHPDVILAGRRINDSMGRFIAQQTVKKMIQARLPVHQALVTVLGLTFKENCPDLRNSRVIDIIQELEEFGCKVQVNDPRADSSEAHAEYGVELTPLEDMEAASAVILAVAHQEYCEWNLETWDSLLLENGVISDVKGIVPIQEWSDKAYGVWRL